MRQILLQKPVLCWALYDWANSAFATTVLAGLFPLFYSALTADVLTTKESQFWFTLTLAISSGVLAVAAPLLGALADQGNRRKKFLATFALLGILMSAALAWVHAGVWWLGLVIYGIGSLGFAAANIFYDAMLLDVAAEDDLDLVSGYGYALGYIGGGILFAVNVWMILQPQTFGLADSNAAVAVAFISVAVWWAVFTLPLLFGVNPRRGTTPATTLESLRHAGRALWQTARELRRFKLLLLFLIGYWLYIDGVGTVIKIAVFFGRRVLDLPQESLIGALLLTQFVAFPAALAFGYLGKHLGPKRGILIGLSVYAAVIVYAWHWLHTSADFYALAIAIGLVQGGVQSLSRSLYARLIPRSKTTEFFGFYNMVGKFASILGPLLMAAVTAFIANADARDPILVLLILFISGGWVLSRVDVAAGQRFATEYDGGGG